MKDMKTSESPLTWRPGFAGLVTCAKPEEKAGNTSL